MIADDLLGIIREDPQKTHLRNIKMIEGQKNLYYESYNDKSKKQIQQ